MNEVERIVSGDLHIARSLYDLVAKEIAPGTGIEVDAFWNALGKAVTELGPRNRQLLDERDRFQSEIDAWHIERRGQPFDAARYRAFLTKIGYLAPQGEPFSITTRNVDAEIATIAGPQLVVPVGNARMALNAVNARWGSLYTALYATDVIAEDDGAERTAEYNETRGARVVAYVADFLDQAIPLANGSHADAVEYRLAREGDGEQLEIELADSSIVRLADASQFVGFKRRDDKLAVVVLRNNGLHIELKFDPHATSGSRHPAALEDVKLEAAVTTIADLEDAEAAVDADDKVRLYRSWLGLMKGTLETTIRQRGEQRVRRITKNRQYTAPNGESLTLSGRSLLLIRNVGIHMYTDAVVDASGRPIPEGFLDAFVTALAALHDLGCDTGLGNSPAGSLYVVKPKMHSPAEVSATRALFEHVERALGLRNNTIKIGIMDEERRMTLNLREAIRAVSERIIFINTGFLDRTGDEIHTVMEAGPVVPKLEMKSTPWIAAYEDNNVDAGIHSGLPGRAQIGKGMWAAPDAMLDMLETKAAHPRAGASTAWVPSPRAAVLHALHYHEVNVANRQSELASRGAASLDDILMLPLLSGRNLSQEEVQHELDNNAQGILGYVVRWIQQGIGCSKVPDIDDVGLMEDRATLRISSQHIANWLHHGLVTRRQIVETFERMARVVDRQNQGDKKYLNMAPDFDGSLAFQAALTLVFEGAKQKNGYTELVLHDYRRRFKSLS